MTHHFHTLMLAMVLNKSLKISKYNLVGGLAKSLLVQNKYTVAGAIVVVAIVYKRKFQSRSRRQDRYLVISHISSRFNKIKFSN